MRTTLDLDKPILDALKTIVAKEKTSLGKLVCRLLAEALARRETAPSPPEELQWNSASMGAKVDLADKDALYSALEAP